MPPSYNKNKLGSWEDLDTWDKCNFCGAQATSTLYQYLTAYWLENKRGVVKCQSQNKCGFIKNKYSPSSFCQIAAVRQCVCMCVCHAGHSVFVLKGLRSPHWPCSPLWSRPQSEMNTVPIFGSLLSPLPFFSHFFLWRANLLSSDFLRVKCFNNRQMSYMHVKIPFCKKGQFRIPTNRD